MRCIRMAVADHQYLGELQDDKQAADWLAWGRKSIQTKL